MYIEIYKKGVIKLARPLLYTLDQLKEKVNAYFDYADSRYDPYTVLDLCNYLGVHRDTLCDWAKAERTFIGLTKDEIEEFSDTIKMAKQRVEAYAERELFKAKNPAGVIFNLKNNFGWVDKHEINNNVTQNGPQLPPMSTEEIRKLLSESE